MPNGYRESDGEMLWDSCVKNMYFKTGATPRHWNFTGPQTATGKLGEVEWFLGSYTIEDFKLENGIATFTVCNKSGWHSGTRLPQSWINEIKEKTSFTISDLVSDAPRGCDATAKSHESSFCVLQKSLAGAFSTVTSAGNDFKLPTKSFLQSIKKSFISTFGSRVGCVIRTKIEEYFPEVLKIPGAEYILNSLPSFGGDWEQRYEIRMEWKK